MYFAMCEGKRMERKNDNVANAAVVLCDEKQNKLAPIAHKKNSSTFSRVLYFFPTITFGNVGNYS